MEGVEVLDFFDSLQQDNVRYLIVLLSTIMVVSVTDWSFGWVNAKFNPSIVFNSGIALYGIIKKMMYFIVLVIFMFVAYLLVPSGVAFASLFTLFVGYLLSELNSVLSHLGLTEDGKTGELFIDFIKNMNKARGSK